MGLNGYYARKPMMGLKQADKAEADIFVMDPGDVDIYNGQLNAARSAQAKAEKDAQKQAHEAYEDANKKAAAKIAAAESAYRQQINDLQSERDNLQYQIDAQEKQIKDLQVRLNNAQHFSANMTRIMRERANQQRGIKPKKDHDGYIVLDSRQYNERYMVYVLNQGIDPKWLQEENIGRALKNHYIHTEQRIYTAWKTTIQTPCDASLPLDTVSEMVWNRLTGDGGQHYGLMTELGCKRFITGMGADSAFPWKLIDPQHGGVVYRLSYRTNYKTGLWEVEVYTTEALEVPADRRPVPTSRKRKDKKDK